MFTPHHVSHVTCHAMVLTCELAFGLKGSALLFPQAYLHKVVHIIGWPKAVMPSRSALSDLGLIADLFEKMPLNWSSFCVKSPLFGQKSQKSDFQCFSLPHKSKNYLEISLIMEYFQIKVDKPNVGIRFLEQV